MPRAPRTALPCTRSMWSTNSRAWRRRSSSNSQSRSGRPSTSRSSTDEIRSLFVLLVRSDLGWRSTQERKYSPTPPRPLRPLVQALQRLVDRPLSITPQRKGCFVAMPARLGVSSLAVAIVEPGDPDNAAPGVGSPIGRLVRCSSRSPTHQGSPPSWRKLARKASTSAGSKRRLEPIL